MSEMTESNPAIQPGATSPLMRIARAERIMTNIAVALADAAALYLLASLLSAHEVCYGMRAGRLLCQPVDAIAAARAALVLLYPGVLFVGAVVGAFWQTRPDVSSEGTAYGLLVSCVVVLIGIVAPAVFGAGLFLVPATVAITIAAILGTIKFIQDYRSKRAHEI